MTTPVRTKVGVSLESGITSGGFYSSLFRASCPPSIVKHTIPAPYGGTGNGDVTTAVRTTVGVSLKSGITSGGFCLSLFRASCPPSIGKHTRYKNMPHTLGGMVGTYNIIYIYI